MIQEQHQMELLETHDTGAEEWHCLQCERRFMVQWPPNFKKIILESGDENAVHSGGKGNLMVHPPFVEKSEDKSSLSDHWLDAFEDLDFGDWPDHPHKDNS